MEMRRREKKEGKISNQVINHSKDLQTFSMTHLKWHPGNML